MVHISGKTAAFPAFSTTHTKSASPSRDYLLRQFARAIAPYSFRAKGSGKSGLLGISRCGQEILERTACVLESFRRQSYHQHGNRLSGQRPHHRLRRSWIRILFDFLPGCVEKSLFYRALDPKACANVARLCGGPAGDPRRIKRKRTHCLHRRRLHSPARDRCFGSADEARRSVYLTGIPARYPRSSKPRTCFRHGNSTRCHTDRRRRLPRKIHPAAGA